MSVSSYDGRSNPHIHTPAINSVVRLGPGGSKKCFNIHFYICVKYSSRIITNSILYCLLFNCIVYFNFNTLFIKKNSLILNFCNVYYFYSIKTF